MEEQQIAKLAEQLRSADSESQQQALEEINLSGNANDFAVDLVQLTGHADEMINESVNSALESISLPLEKHWEALAQFAQESARDEGKMDQAYWAVTLIGMYENRPAEALEILKTVADQATHPTVKRRAERMMQKF